jgi:hypothetical protein
MLSFPFFFLSFFLFPLLFFFHKMGSCVVQVAGWRVCKIPTWLRPQGVFKKQFRKNIEVLVNLVEILLV